MATQRSTLENKIIEKLNQAPFKRITFKEFMNMALYYPELGYYTKDRTKIGKNADFYTSSSVGSIFGQVIANSFIEMFQHITKGNPQILELGGGDGRFARDVLDELKRNHEAIYSHITYYMLEASPFHEKIQKEYIAEHLSHVVWINDLDELKGPFSGIIFSNELFDAFSVHKVIQKNDELKEIFVEWDEEKAQFIELIDNLSDERLKQYFDDQGIKLVDGQTTEVNLEAIDWMRKLSATLDQGYIITIDYGYPAEEIYATHRHEGTLMCYYQHLANDNPYQNIGNQDITTHVNFSMLMDCGEKYDLENICFTTQSNYLLNNGILNYLQEIDFESHQKRDIFVDKALKLNRAIRQLITPGEMGETFKVLVQQKNISNHNYNFLIDVWHQRGLM